MVWLWTAAPQEAVTRRWAAVLSATMNQGGRKRRKGRHSGGCCGQQTRTPAAIVPLASPSVLTASTETDARAISTLALVDVMVSGVGG
jgi:hypothetical protein